MFCLSASHTRARDPGLSSPANEDGSGELLVNSLKVGGNMLLVAKVFLYAGFAVLLILIIANIVYSIRSRKHNGRVGVKGKMYKNTKSIMKDDSAAGKFPPILHFDEAKAKGGKGNDL